MEASADEINAGDASRLTRPIYVACSSDSRRLSIAGLLDIPQYDVVRVRYKYHVPARLHPGKVLLLDKTWTDDPDTAAFVEWWVRDLDLPTIDLDLEPYPLDDESKRPRCAILLLGIGSVSLLFAVIAILRGEMDFAVVWTVACTGWLYSGILRAAMK